MTRCFRASAGACTPPWPGAVPAPGHDRRRRAGRPVARGRPAAALAASIEAARAAAGVYAYSEAVEHYSAAVALWSSADATNLDRAEILLDAADAAYRAGADGLPIEWCKLGLAALGEDPDPRRAATFFERLGRFQDHHLDKSLSYYNEALLCLDDAPSAERARLLGDESLTLTLSVRWDEARELAERALVVAQEAGADAEEGFARSVLGLVLAYLGEFETAEAHLDEARRIGEALERPEDASRAYVHLGEVRRLRGDLPGALEVMAAGLEAARRLGVEASYGRYFALNAASDEYELGHWNAAQERIDRLTGASLTWSGDAPAPHGLGPARGGAGRLRARSRVARRGQRTTARVLGDGVDGLRRGVRGRAAADRGRVRAGPGDRRRRARARARAGGAALHAGAGRGGRAGGGGCRHPTGAT